MWTYCESGIWLLVYMRKDRHDQRTLRWAQVFLQILDLAKYQSPQRTLFSVTTHSVYTSSATAFASYHRHKATVVQLWQTNSRHLSHMQLCTPKRHQLRPERRSNQRHRIRW